MPGAALPVLSLQLSIVAVAFAAAAVPAGVPGVGCDAARSGNYIALGATRAGKGLHLLDTDSSCQATRRQESPKSAITFSSPPRARM